MHYSLSLKPDTTALEVEGSQGASQGFSHVFKANPYHDAEGQFTSKDKDADGQPSGLKPETKEQWKARQPKVQNLSAPSTGSKRFEDAANEDHDKSIMDALIANPKNTGDRGRAAILETMTAHWAAQKGKGKDANENKFIEGRAAAVQRLKDKDAARAARQEKDKQATSDALGVSREKMLTNAGLSTKVPSVSESWAKYMASKAKPAEAKAAPEPKAGPKAIPANRVQVDGENRYMFANGKRPGGKGSWMFAAKPSIDWSKDPKAGEDYFQSTHDTTYSQAKSQAKAWAGSKGIGKIMVQT